VHETSCHPEAPSTVCIWGYQHGGHTKTTFTFKKVTFHSLQGILRRICTRDAPSPLDEHSREDLNTIPLSPTVRNDGMNPDLPVTVIIWS